MTLSEINEYTQGYKYGSKWLARQHSLAEIELVALRLQQHDHDLWERGYSNALTDYIKRSRAH